MLEEDQLLLWRLAADLSVEDAAILIAGGDPGVMDTTYPDGMFNGDGISVKRTTGHPGFAAAFSGLKSAVLRGHITATLQYRGRSIRDPNEYPQEDFHVISKSTFSSLLATDVDPQSVECGKIAIDREPDWSTTMINVDDLISWLRSRGHSTGFFFSSDQPDVDEFMDKSHEHFSSELALAVSAWRALARQQKFPKGPKVAVECWINENPDAWKADEPLSGEAKKRIMTLVNWRKSGGANPTGG